MKKSTICRIDNPEVLTTVGVEGTDKTDYITFNTAIEAIEIIDNVCIKLWIKDSIAIEAFDGLINSFIERKKYLREKLHTSDNINLFINNNRIFPSSIHKCICIYGGLKSTVYEIRGVILA